MSKGLNEKTSTVRDSRNQQVAIPQGQPAESAPKLPPVMNESMTKRAIKTIVNSDVGKSEVRFNLLKVALAINEKLGGEFMEASLAPILKGVSSNGQHAIRDSVGADQGS